MGGIEGIDGMGGIDGMVGIGSVGLPPGQVSEEILVKQEMR